jgi:16S rRNA G966 N2-methylase RsmD
MNEMDFPWRVYTEEEIQKEYLNLQKKLKNKFTPPLSTSRIGYKCTDKFFQKQRLNTPSDTNISCVKYWCKKKEKIIEYQQKQKYKKDLFGTIVFMKKAPSHFSPYIAGCIYKYFNATKVLDPYAGWGDRCLAAMALGIDYIGIDSNPNIISCFQDMISTFVHKGEICIINDKCENIDLKSFKADLIFSSPPFWKNKKLLEKYTGCEVDYDKFLKESLFKIFNLFQGLIPICLYINNQMYNSLEKHFGKPKEIIPFNSSTVLRSSNRTIHSIYCW